MKFFLTALIYLFILTATASADFLRVELGVGAWIQTSSGDMSVSDVSDDTRHTKAYSWLLVKHPVPVIPNLRVESVSVESMSVNTLTTLEITQYDIIPYYNILDNTAWITLDLGVDFKMLEASKETIGSITDTVSFPLLYVRTRFQLPFSNFGIESDVKYLSYDNNTIYDIRAKVDYIFTSFSMIELAVELGYRVQKIETKELFSTKINLEYSGVYTGLNFRF